MDQGPGIGDLPCALGEGFRTSKSLGLCLKGAVDEFNIDRSWMSNFRAANCFRLGFQLIIWNNARIPRQFADLTGPPVGLYADLANEIRYLACKALTDHCGLIGHQNALNISIGRGGLLQDAQKSTNSGSSRVWPQPAGRNRCGKILMTRPPFHRYCTSRLLRGRTIRAFALTNPKRKRTLPPTPAWVVDRSY
jgi:hypothetical protein